MKQDPQLASHLSTFGINVQVLSKTEKSITELVRIYPSININFSLSSMLYLTAQQLELNLKYDFSLTSEDGTALEPVFGSGLTGLQNLGNSCYMASVLQTLFSLKPFQGTFS